jgi:aspartyl protease
MLLKFIVALAVISVLMASQVYAASRVDNKPQVIKLQRFRKALWKVHVTVKGKQGDFLLDTGGGITLLTDDFSKDLYCKFWGRTTGYNMFGKRSDGPHCDNVQIKAGDVALTPTNSQVIKILTGCCRLMRSTARRSRLISRLELLPLRHQEASPSEQKQ